MALPEKQRVAVLLHKYEEMDYGEIAKTVGMLGKRVEVAAVSRLRDLANAAGPPCVPASGPSRRGRTAIGRQEV